MMGASGSCVEMQSEVSQHRSNRCPEVTREAHLVLSLPGLVSRSSCLSRAWEHARRMFSTFKHKSMKLVRGISMCTDGLCWHLQNPSNGNSLLSFMSLSYRAWVCNQEQFPDRICGWRTQEVVGTQPHLSLTIADQFPCSLGWKEGASWKARGLFWVQLAFSVTESPKEISHMHSRYTSYLGNFNYLTKVIKYAWEGNIQQVYKLVDKLIST